MAGPPFQISIGNFFASACVKVADNERLLLKIIETLYYKNECHNEAFSGSRLWHNFPTSKDSLIQLYTKKIGERICSLYVHG